MGEPEAHREARLLAEPVTLGFPPVGDRVPEAEGLGAAEPELLPQAPAEAEEELLTLAEKVAEAEAEAEALPEADWLPEPRLLPLEHRVPEAVTEALPQELTVLLLAAEEEALALAEAEASALRVACTLGGLLPLPVAQAVVLPELQLDWEGVAEAAREPLGELL